MLDETHFTAVAGATLMHCFDQLEEAYERGEIDELELAEGVLTIETPDGKTFVISKHGPSRQLWLASPFSGGLHFSYRQGDQCWLLPDGRPFYDVLVADLMLAGVKVIL